MDSLLDSFSIDGRAVGPGQPPYLIAELSGNHNGELSRALALVDAAADAGVDAVKLQTYRADTITIRSDRPEFHIQGGIWDGRQLYDLYQEASTPWEWHEALFKRAAERGLTCFSSPFDPSAVDYLAALEAPAYKIASFELVDTPLIRYAAAQNKPLIMSTGVANYADIEAACSAAQAADGLALLHCVSSYPAPVETMNLRTIPVLAETFGVPIGLSDHSPGTAVAVAAVALGAAIIEKHLTLSRADGGPDADFSLEPAEFKRRVEDCHTADKALGTAIRQREAVGKSSEESAGSSAAQFRRSLYIVEDIAAGERLTERHVRSIRPGLGLAPKHLPQVLGMRAARALKSGEALAWDMLLA